MNTTKILNSAAKNTLLLLINQSRWKERRKNDKEFNWHLSQRRNFPKHGAKYKTITKAVKKWTQHLRNEKLRQETDKINKNKNRRQVEELYKNIKDRNTTFTIKCKKQLCDPHKLKEHFKAHFTICFDVVDSIEFKDVSSFIRQLQDVNNTELDTTPPDLEKLKSTVKSLKNCKSANDVPSDFVKHAMEWVQRVYPWDD